MGRGPPGLRPGRRLPHGGLGRICLAHPGDGIGGELAQSRLGLPKSLTGVFQGLLLFTLLACDTLVNYRLKWSK